MRLPSESWAGVVPVSQNEVRRVRPSARWVKRIGTTAAPFIYIDDAQKWQDKVVRWGHSAMTGITRVDCPGCDLDGLLCGSCHEMEAALPAGQSEG